MISDHGSDVSVAVTGVAAMLVQLAVHLAPMQNKKFNKINNLRGRLGRLRKTGTPSPGGYGGYIELHTEGGLWR